MVDDIPDFLSRAVGTNILYLQHVNLFILFSTNIKSLWNKNIILDKNNLKYIHKTTVLTIDTSLIFHQIPFDKFIQISVQDILRISTLYAGAEVFHQFVWV